MQNYAANANKDVNLTVEMCDVFNFLWDQGAHMFFWKEKQSWSIACFIKSNLTEFPILK